MPEFAAVALGRDQKWRSRWTRVVGALAFWKVIGLYSIGRAAPLVNEWAAADDGALRRAFRFSAGWRLLVATAALLSVAMFINVGWILADTNQAFRVLVADHLVERGALDPVARGVNELTLVQLATLGYWFECHTRWALSVATLVLVQFASTVSRRLQGRWPSIAVGLVAVIVYLWSLQTLQRSHISPLEAWAPNLIFILSTVLMVQFAPPRRDAASPRE